MVFAVIEHCGYSWILSILCLRQLEEKWKEHNVPLYAVLSTSQWLLIQCSESMDVLMLLIYQSFEGTAQRNASTCESRKLYLQGIITYDVSDVNLSPPPHLNEIPPKNKDNSVRPILLICSHQWWKARLRARSDTVLSLPNSNARSSLWRFWGRYLHPDSYWCWPV